MQTQSKHETLEWLIKAVRNHRVHGRDTTRGFTTTIIFYFRIIHVVFCISNSENNEGKNYKILLGVVPPSRSPNCIWKKSHLIIQHLAYTFTYIAYTSRYAINISWNIGQCRFFVASGIDHGILIDLFEDCAVYLIWTAWVLFDFYLKQKQMFSVWSYSNNVSFISFHGAIWCRYSEINNLK